MTIDEIMEKADYAYSREDDLKKVLKLTCEAVEIDPTDIRPWDLMGVALFEVGENEESLNCYEKILELEPENEDAKLKKGQMLNELGNFDEASSIYDELIESNSSRKDEAILAKLTLTLETGNEKLFRETLTICNETIEKEDSKLLKDEIGFILSMHEVMPNMK